MNALISGTIAPVVSTAVNTTASRIVGTTADNLLLPTVSSGASVRWSQSRKPETARVTIDTRLDATVPDVDVVAAADAEEVRRVKKYRKTEKAFENLAVGTVVYVAAKSWKEYSKKWLYPFALDEAYVRGRCTSVDIENGLIGLDFEVFGIENVQQNLTYVRRWCKHLNVMPADGKEITLALYEQYENLSTPEQWIPQLNDQVFICAKAWELTSYKDVPWRYPADIRDSYFEATVMEVKTKKYAIQYKSFSLGHFNKVSALTISYYIYHFHTYSTLLWHLFRNGAAINFLMMLI
jgi:hypothetical protein